MALKGGDNLVMSRLGHKLPDMTKKKKKIVFEEYDPAEVSKAQNLEHSPTSKTEVPSIIEGSQIETTAPTDHLSLTSKTEAPSKTVATPETEVTVNLDVTSASMATSKTEVTIVTEGTNNPDVASIMEVNKRTPSVSEVTSKSELTTKTEAPSLLEVSHKEGFTRLNHTVLEKLCQLDLGAREYKLILYIVRQTLGWNREWVELSATDIERAMGWNNSQVWKTIPGLRDIHQCILVRREEGSQKNFYSLNPKVFGRLLPSKREVTSKSEVAYERDVKTTSESEVDTTFQIRSGEGDLDKLSEPIFGSLKKSIKDNLNKSLSLIEDFFQSVKSPERLRREREAFGSIQQANPEITDRELLGCLNKAKTNSKIDSPFVYLAGGYLDKVLPVVRTEIEKELAKELYSKQLEVALAEFNRQLNEQQRTEMREWIQKNHTDGYKLHDDELERRAAFTWLSNKRSELFLTIAL